MKRHTKLLQSSLILLLLMLAPSNLMAQDSELLSQHRIMGTVLDSYDIRIRKLRSTDTDGCLFGLYFY